MTRHYLVRWCHMPCARFADGGFAAWTVGTDIIQDHWPECNQKEPQGYAQMRGRFASQHQGTHFQVTQGHAYDPIPKSAIGHSGLGRHQKTQNVQFLDKSGDIRQLARTSCLSRGCALSHRATQMKKLKGAPPQQTPISKRTISR